jgi:hypothetical protein
MKGLRDIIDFSWDVVKFFLNSFDLLVTNCFLVQR